MPVLSTGVVDWSFSPEPSGDGVVNIVAVGVFVRLRGALFVHGIAGHVQHAAITPSPTGMLIRLPLW